MTNPLVSTRTLEQMSGRTLGDADRLRLSQSLDSMYSFIENYLHKKLQPTAIVDEEHFIPGEFDKVYPFWAPLRQINYVRFGDVTSASTTAYNSSLMDETFPGYTVIYISYEAGYSVAAPELEIVKNAMTDAALRELYQGTGIYTGLTSYSVEGTSVSYSSSKSPNDMGPFTDVELKQLAVLRRPTVA